jgi:putative spermidine/putrescine transport system substrate-binding protein
MTRVVVQRMTRSVVILGALAVACMASASLAAGANALEEKARAEGKLFSLGMPDQWANWGGTWADLKKMHGIAHTDTDMSSAEEIAKFEAERSNATADIADVGFEFAPLAAQRGLTLPYKPGTWAEIPAWARDTDGHWAVAYTGTIAFAVNTKRTAGAVPRSWRSLADSKWRVAIGEVGRAAQANAGVLSAAIALGGSESQLKPALDLFAKLAREGRLVTTNPQPSQMERGEADVYVLWDFNGLSYREKLPNRGDYEVLIPSDGSVTSGYATIINKYAPHPNAAMLAREYIFSDAGQLNLARGHARPIRIDRIKLPEDVKAQLIPNQQYSVARPVQAEDWARAVKLLPRKWQSDVLSGK